tara:strand:- start:775 stop:1257 length:483 start_codon:yes stop_codon:yes gene_type:complete
MALTFKERLKHNLFIWFFGLTKVRLILFCRPKIVDINDDEVILCIPLNRQTRNHVNSMYIGAMTVGADLVTGITAMLNIRKSKRNIVLIFKDINAKFFKRAEGNTHFICKYKKEIEQAVQEVITSKDRVNLEVPIIATVPEKLGNEPVAEFKITLSMKEK